MKPHRPVYVVGGGHSPFTGKGHPEFITRRHPDFGQRENPSVSDHMKLALRAAADATGVDYDQVDKVYVSNFLGECFVKQGHLGSLAVAAEPRLDGKPIARLEAACASGAASVAACVDALQAGCDVTLALGVEIESNVRGSEGVEYMAYAAHYAKQRGLDTFLFPYLFARRAQKYKEAYGATSDDLARVAAKAHGNARLNPLARNRSSSIDFQVAAKVSEENHLFLEDPELHEHIRISDCTQFTDGASAVILATDEGLSRLGLAKSHCSEILSYGYSTAALGAKTDATFMHNMARAAKTAYADAELTHSQIGIAEVHDCFSIAELQMYEALGFCDVGHAPAFLAEGHTQIDGQLPVNTGGGLLGFGHPIGATGIKQVVEIWRQMKGRCGDYQVSHAPEYGLSANLGGDDRTGVVLIQQNCH